MKCQLAHHPRQAAPRPLPKRQPHLQSDEIDKTIFHRNATRKHAALGTAPASDIAPPPPSTAPRDLGTASPSRPADPAARPLDRATSWRSRNSMAAARSIRAEPALPPRLLSAPGRIHRDALGERERRSRSFAPAPRQRPAARPAARRVLASRRRRSARAPGREARARALTEHRPRIRRRAPRRAPAARRRRSRNPRAAVRSAPATGWADAPSRKSRTRPTPCRSSGPRRRSVAVGAAKFPRGSSASLAAGVFSNPESQQPTCSDRHSQSGPGPTLPPASADRLPSSDRRPSDSNGARRRS